MDVQVIDFVELMAVGVESLESQLVLLVITYYIRLRESL